MKPHFSMPHAAANPMTVASQAQQMAKQCNNERLAMTMQYVAIGSMILMAAASASHLFKDILSHNHGSSRGRE